jgi:aryl-alcohol dehydrogenase-like predicted oxidoreductase
MEKREIGQSGIKASVVGLGCNNYGIFQDRAQADACIHAALDAGITMFDMASEHGAGLEEELVADALGARRNDVIISTKFGQQEVLGAAGAAGAQAAPDPLRQGASRRWIMQSVEESLRRLKRDYIDLYQPHVIDPEVPADEMLRALDDLVREGKVRAIGQAATMATAADTAAQLDVVAAHGLTPYVSVQTQYNLLARDAEREIIPQLRARKMSLLPYFPLANGVLTGKYRQNAPYPAGSRLETMPMVLDFQGPPPWEKVEKLRAFAEARSLTMVDLAIGWLLSEPVVTSVIAGATKPEQITANARAAEVRISPADRAELDLILQ